MDGAGAGAAADLESPSGIHKSKSSKPTMAIYKPPARRQFMEHVLQANGINNFYCRKSKRTGMRSDTKEVREVPAKPAEKKHNGVKVKKEEITLEEIDVEGYIEEARPFLEHAVTDPSTLEPVYMGEVAKVICNRAMDEKKYCSVAGKMFKVIIQKEAESRDSKTFHQCLMTALELLHEQRERMKEEEAFTSYIFLLSETYRCLHSLKCDLAKALEFLFTCFDSVLDPEDGNYNYEEFECLCAVLLSVGQYLEKDASDKMGNLVSQARSLFINGLVPEWARHLLLFIIELRASRWSLPDEVSRYYQENNHH